MKRRWILYLIIPVAIIWFVTHKKEKLAAVKRQQSNQSSITSRPTKDNKSDKKPKLQKRATTVEETHPASKSTQEEIFKIKDHKNKPVEKSDNQITGTKEDSFDDFSDDIDEVWNDRMYQFVVKELKLTESVFAEYLKLKGSLEQETLEIFKELNNQMDEQQQDENAMFSPSEDQMQFEEKLRREYLDTLRKIFGEDNFTKYKKEIEKFNNDIKKGSDPDTGTITVNF